MKKTFKIIVMTIGAFLITAGHSQANTVVYEKVELFQTETFFTDTFTVIDAGTYMATVTDFEFPVPMDATGMSVTTATDSLGKLLAPGSFLSASLVLPMCPHHNSDSTVSRSARYRFQQQHGCFVLV